MKKFVACLAAALLAIAIALPTVAEAKGKKRTHHKKPPPAPSCMYASSPVFGLCILPWMWK